MNPPKSQSSTPPPSPADPVPNEYDLLCEGCGYSLIGLLTDRCPECGRQFDPSELPLARMPWLYRVRLGGIRAYLKTVLLILWTPSAFAKELTRPVRVSRKDAFRFRQITIRIVWWTIILAVVLTIAGFLAMQIRLHWREMHLLAFMDYVAIVIISCGAMFGLWLALWLATDLPTFIWRGLPADPNNLAPLHHYACAPLVLLPICAAISGFIGVMWTEYWSPAESTWLPWIVASFPTAFVVWKLWRIPQIFMREATACGRSRQLMMAVYLPVHWTLMLALGFASMAITGALIDMLK